MAEESQDQSQRTEDPTPKRLADAHEKGQVATSREVNNWFMLLGGTILVMVLAPSFLDHLKALLARYIAFSYDFALGGGGAGEVLQDLILSVAGVMVLPLAVLGLLAALSSLVQNGPIFAAESIKPKLEKISPAKGFKRMFSVRSLVEFVKGLLKLAVVGAVATLVIVPKFESLTQFPRLPMQAFMHVLWSIASTMLIAVLAVVTVIAGLDFLYQKLHHFQELRMSRQEIKDELKQTDGDPMVKARLRQIRSERARQRMMAAVPESTVVVTNPTHFAVALKYEHEEMEAPEVVAKGADLVAMRIREVAEEAGVPLVENPPLARALFAGVEVGQQVPPEHYRTVAEVIGYVMRLKSGPGRR